MMPLRDDQYISLSPTDSPAEDAEMGTGAESPAAPLEYEVTGEIGRPHWELIFEHVLRQCGYLSGFHTVYVMVDNRDLANHQRQDPSLPHWPAAAKWWHSRLKLMGPHKEKTELLLFPISESTGLHHVHPTWAGTFVLCISWDQLRLAG